MGFFFSGKNTTKKLSKLPDTLIHESGCKVCPNKINNKSYNMPPTGDAEPIIYILGEHPTKNDVEDSLHFSDASGTLLRTILRKQFPDFFPSNNIFKSVNIRYNNILRCIPKDTIPTQLELDCCRKQVEDDIEQSKPLIVIGLCNLEGDYFLDKKEKKSMLVNWMVDGRYCSHWRGRKIPMKMGNHPFWFFPIIHPAFVLKKRRKNNKSEFDNCFEKDINNIADFLEDYKEPIIIESGYRDNIKVFMGKDKSEIIEIKKELEILANEPEIAVDIETHNLHPWTLSDLTDKHPLMKLPSRILSIAIGTDKYTIVFPIDHPLAWDDSYRQDVRDLLKEFLLHSGTKICHYLKFEATWFNHYFGQDVLRKTQWSDTSAQAYIIDERTSLEEGMLALDRLCYINFGFNLKVLSNIDRKACIKAPLERLLLYNGMDTKYTYKLYQIQKLLIAKKQEWLLNHLNKASFTTAIAETKGLLTNGELYKKLLIDYTGDEDYILNKDELVRGGKIGKSVELIQSQDCVKEYEKIYGEFNPNSGPHLAKLFGKILKLTALNSTANGAFSTDEDSLQEFAKKHPIAKYILEYKKFSKLLSTYITPVPNLINNVDKRIHADFKTMFTGTGRFCVAKDTMIEVVRDISKHPLGILIQDVKKGDLVYTYDDNCKLTLKPVLWGEKTGHYKVVRIHWKGQGGHHKGYLDVTENHKIRLTTGEYREARYLKKNDRVLAVRREIKNHSFLYHTGRKERLSDHRFIYSVVNNINLPDKHDIHHKDHNKLNNSPDNLECLTDSKHCSYHSNFYYSDEKNRYRGVETLRRKRASGELPQLPSGKEHWCYKDLSKFECLRLVASCRGDFTKVTEVNHETLYKRLQEHGIEYNNLKLRYLKNGTYLSKGYLQKLILEKGYTKTLRYLKADNYKLKRLLDIYGIKLRGKFFDVRKKTGTKFGCLRTLAEVKGDISKLPFDRWSFIVKLKSYGIDYKQIKERYEIPANNHLIDRIEYLDDSVDVYDIGVQGTHNFIANEICVHNSCENPNLQNWPSRNNKWVRQLVVPPENHMIVAADYAQLEARIVGTVSQDKVFCDLIWQDFDIHLDWTIRICKRYPQIVGKTKFEDITEDELKAFRKVVKGAWVFQIIYGGSKYSVAQQVGLPMEIMDVMYEEFWDTLKGAKQWQESTTKFYLDKEYVETPTGRRRHGPMHANKHLNAPIQGGSSDIVVNAMNNLSELAYSLNKPQYQAVINIHDDLTFYIPEDSLEEDIDFIAKQMTKVEFDWITVPLGIEVSVGKNWGQLEEVAKFRTDDFWDFKRR